MNTIDPMVIVQQAVGQFALLSMPSQKASYTSDLLWKILSLLIAVIGEFFTGIMKIPD